MKHLLISMILLLNISIYSQAPVYDRSIWGHFNDNDNDQMDTRAEVLVKYAIKGTPVVIINGIVKAGIWIDYYTGDTLTDPSNIDIDHLVSIKDCDISGGGYWYGSKKHIFYNYKPNLVVTSSSINRSKGSKTPLMWSPPNIKLARRYMLRYIRVKKYWRLSITVDEKRYMQTILGRRIDLEIR